MEVDEELDPIFFDVARFLIDSAACSVTSIQRKFIIGYNRASQIMDKLQSLGLVTEIGPTGNRTLAYKNYDLWLKSISCRNVNDSETQDMTNVIQWPGRKQK